MAPHSSWSSSRLWSCAAASPIFIAPSAFPEACQEPSPSASAQPCSYVFALWAARNEQVLGLNALLFAAAVALAGAAVFGVTELLRRRALA